jgi:tetratricopeptide (TPR) repeat protein
MRTLLWIGLLAAILGAPPAQGETFWGQTLRGDTRQRDRAVEEGNLHLREAKQRRSHFDRGGTFRHTIVFDPARAALRSYERALAIGPREREIHDRALIAATFISDPGPGGPELCAPCRDGYEGVVRHIDAIRKLHPHDTREVSHAWQLAVVLSKLGGLGGPAADGYFERAIKEYELWRRLVDETDPNVSRNLSTSYGNAAELLMAVGRLDEAIALYQLSIDLNPLEPLHYFGLAVAYDRDGQWEKAVTTMRDALGRLPGLQRLEADQVFFVPAGDEIYYHALAQLVMGTDREVVRALFTRFLTKARESKYHARAREHLADLARGAAATGR